MTSDGWEGESGTDLAPRLFQQADIDDRQGGKAFKLAFRIVEGRKNHRSPPQVTLTALSQTGMTWSADLQ